MYIPPESLNKTIATTLTQSKYKLEFLQNIMQCLIQILRDDSYMQSTYRAGGRADLAFILHSDWSDITQLMD